MTIRASVFIATSLDGFIARLDDRIDWLDQANATVPEGEDCGYKAFMESVDVLVMGRNTFETALGFPDWPYREKRVVVLSTRGVEIPEPLRSTVSTTADPPRALMERLGAEGAHHLYVDGGKTIQSFLAGGLLTDLTITVIPVLLGSGKALFGALPSDVWLEHLSTVAYPFGFVQTRYRVRERA